jgi:hypothetical protein
MEEGKQQRFRGRSWPTSIQALKCGPVDDHRGRGRHVCRRAKNPLQHGRHRSPRIRDGSRPVMMRPVGGTGCAGPSRIGIPTAATSVPVAVTVRPRSGLNRRYATPAVSGSNTSSYCRPPTPPRPARDRAWLPAGRDRRNRPPQAVQQYQVRHYLKDVDKPGPGRGRTESTLTSGAKRFQHRPYAIGACRRDRRVRWMLPRLFRTPTFMPASPPVISLPAIEASRDACD